MTPPKQGQRPDFSDSERLRLNQLLRDLEYQKRIAEEKEAARKKRHEAIRIWTLLASTAVLAIGWIKDGIPWLVTHLGALFKYIVGIP